jgi:hypothetical protein
MQLANLEALIFLLPYKIDFAWYFVLEMDCPLTADVDIAGKTVPVAIIPEVVCPQSALERLEMGFSPMMEADPALHGSRFKAQAGEFKVEFLTPLTG